VPDLTVSAVDRKTKNNQKLFRGTFEGEFLDLPSYIADLYSPSSGRLYRRVPRRDITH
jgi:hypothetical protein